MLDDDICVEKSADPLGWLQDGEDEKSADPLGWLQDGEDVSASEYVE
jgi:hypothetical protein